MIGTVVLVAALVPYLVFSGRDNRYHFSLRKVTKAEHFIHVVTLLTVLALCIGVFRRDLVQSLIALALFVPPALVDELVFHRDLPSEEHDVHAKAHLMLFVFVIAGAVVGAVEKGALPFLQRAA